MTVINYPPYDTLRESWWIWELENGNIIKVKNIITLFQSKNIKKSDKKELGFKMKTIVALSNINVEDMLKLPVPKSKLWKGSNDKSLKIEDINEFKTIFDKNNYYEIYPDEKSTLLFAIRPASIFIQKYNKYTEEGEPVYNVSTQQQITLSSMTEGLVEKIDVDSEELNKYTDIEEE